MKPQRVLPDATQLSSPHGRNGLLEESLTVKAQDFSSQELTGIGFRDHPMSPWACDLKRLKTVLGKFFGIFFSRQYQITRVMQIKIKVKSKRCLLWLILYEVYLHPLIFSRKDYQWKTHERKHKLWRQLLIHGWWRNKPNWLPTAMSTTILAAVNYYDLRIKQRTCYDLLFSSAWLDFIIWRYLINFIC